MHTLLWYTVFVCLAVFFHERSILCRDLPHITYSVLKPATDLALPRSDGSLWKTILRLASGFRDRIFSFTIFLLMLSIKITSALSRTRPTPGNFCFSCFKSRFLFPKGKKRQIAESYIAGFIGHYLLDTTCHPYVYDRSKSCSDSATAFAPHVYLETDIDTAFLRHYKKSCLRNSIRSAPSL